MTDNFGRCYPGNVSECATHYLGDVNITGKEGDKVSSYKELPFAGKHC
jgi:hypothetical protein